MSKKIRLIVPVFALFLAILACSSIPGLGSEPSPTPTPSPEPTQTPANLEELIRQAIRQAREEGQVTIQVTEQQITQALRLRMLDQPNLPFANPQIFFRDGKVEFLADVENAGITATLQVVMTVEADASGVPVFKVESAEWGFFPVPAELVTTLESAINQALEAQFLAGAEGLQISAIRVGEGFLEVTLQVDQ